MQGMSKETQKHEHKVGPGYGYETDGANYWLAPGLVDAWGTIQDQERGLDAVLEAVTRTVAEARRYVEAQRRRWWDTVYKDLELDKSVLYSFNRIEGKLSPAVKENIVVEGK